MEAFPCSHVPAVMPCYVICSPGFTAQRFTSTIPLFVLCSLGSTVIAVAIALKRCGQRCSYLLLCWLLLWLDNALLLLLVPTASNASALCLQPKLQAHMNVCSAMSFSCIDCSRTFDCKSVHVSCTFVARVQKTHNTCLFLFLTYSLELASVGEKLQGRGGRMPCSTALSEAV